MPNHFHKPTYADDATERVGLLLRLRLPWLIIGLVVGWIITVYVSNFEEVLTEHIELAFFIPVIVYLSDAVGTQTETIYVRNLARRPVKFTIYLIKELLLGIILGLIFGLLLGLGAFLWFGKQDIALTVGLAMFASIACAAIVGLITPTILYRENTDPAVGAGPFATVIQDLASVLIYFSVAKWIVFS